MSRQRCKPVGRSMEDLKAVALKVHKAVFGAAETVVLDRRIFPVKRTSQAKVRRVMIDEYTFLEQNSVKLSRWGKLAREGHQILGVLRGSQYLARVQDGRFHSLKR